VWDNIEVVEVVDDNMVVVVVDASPLVASLVEVDSTLGQNKDTFGFGFGFGNSFSFVNSFVNSFVLIILLFGIIKE
jgi:hypothetical protein